MDYEVFILARMREEYDRTGSTDEAVVRGMAVTGRLVTSAALIVFLAFASMATAGRHRPAGARHRTRRRRPHRRAHRALAARPRHRLLARPLELVDARARPAAPAPARGRTGRRVMNTSPARAPGDKHEALDSARMMARPRHHDRGMPTGRGRSPTAPEALLPPQTAAPRRARSKRWRPLRMDGAARDTGARTVQAPLPFRRKGQRVSSSRTVVEGSRLPAARPPACPGSPRGSVRRCTDVSSAVAG